jgi:hypothetical protein
MRGVTPPFAQVTVIGIVAKVETSAERGTSTLQVETTVAVTKRGAEADCAYTSAGALARMAAARTVRTIPSILTRDPDVLIASPARARTRAAFP